MPAKKEISFLSFIKNRQQRTDWLILSLSCIVGYLILRICYPYPATMSDSGTYVSAAAGDFFTFYRPFGFSYLLQIIHAFSSSIHAVFIGQMLLYFTATAAFSLTIKYFFPPAKKWLWCTLLFLFVFNPMMFYMANAIMSDLIFAVMIYFMLASFMFVFKKQSWPALAIFMFTLFSALHIRYSAIVFPFVFGIFFLMIKGKMRWISIAGTLFVFFVFYNQIKSNMKETVGIEQYSTGFDGWQIANNGLHVLPFIDLDANKISNPDIRSTHLFMTQYKDIILKKTENGTDAVAYFMWINDLPLKQGLYAYIQSSQTPYPIAWVQLGSGPYKRYGTYLIKNYPVQFAKHYYLPNAKQIFYPTKTGLIGNYTPINIKDIFEWYNIPSDKDVNVKHPIYSDWIAKLIPGVYALIWIVTLAVGILAFVRRKSLNLGKGKIRLLQSMALFGIIYYTSTTFASPIELRFWLSMAAIHFSIIYILTNSIVEAGMKKQN